jgi:hypothetical protein
MADRYEEKIRNKDFTPISFKSKLKETPELLQAKQRLASLKETLQKMRDDEGITEKLRIEKIKENLKRSYKYYEDKIKNKDYVPKVKKVTELDEEGLRLEMERNKIKFQYDTEQEKARIKNRPMPQKVRDLLVDLFNIPKAFRASMDFSAPLRQGAILSFSHPIIASKAFKEMFVQTFSPKKSELWMNRLKASDDYIKMKKAGLYLAESTSKLAAKEEQFMTNLAHKIPVLGKLFAGSERAYVGYLNKLRVDVYSQGHTYLDSLGYNFQKNSDKYAALADFINNATGRGKLGFLEPIAKELNAAMFSPRLVASRINLLNPVKYYKMPKEIRKMALRDMGIFVGTGLMILSLYKLAGADVEEDPRSADFGKIKIGNLRLDIWAGFQQVVRAFTQLVTGQRKSTKTGKVSKISKKEFPFKGRMSVVGQFARSKLSPSMALVVDILEEENMMGEKVTPEMIAENVFLPLYLGDVVEIYKEEGLGITGLAATLSLFGVGAQYYSETNIVKHSYSKGMTLPETLKQVEAKKGKLTKEKKKDIEKEYSVYRRYGINDENINFLISNISNNDKVEYMLSKNMDIKQVSKYYATGVISEDTYKKYIIKKAQTKNK